MKLVLAIPHSHGWFFTQTCVAMLHRYPPVAAGVDCQIVVVDNSPWSPAIRGIMDTRLGDGISVVLNSKSNRFHASALDDVVENWDFDYLMAFETDVLALRPDWLQWFMDQLKPTDFAAGHFHHESFINPSCTLYRGIVLRDMLEWCRANKEPELLRWGPDFRNTQEIAARQPERDYRGWYNDNISWIVGPFAEKRGWPAGTRLKEKPSGQEKGPGWMEPGQQLHHWAVEAGYTYTVVPTDTKEKHHGLPVQTLYGPTFPVGPLEPKDIDGAARTVHLWGGTRALDIIKHDVTCQFVGGNTPFWLEREARFWMTLVPEDVRTKTLELIRQYGWHYRGQGTPDVTDRDRAAAKFVQECYAKGGIQF